MALRFSGRSSQSYDYPLTIGHLLDRVRVSTHTIMSSKGKP